MEQVIEFFQKLFDSQDWPPRWNCGKWTEFHGWFYIASDLLTWAAYFAIPLTILSYIKRLFDGKFAKTYLLLAAFFLASGSTHLLDVVSFWFPAYRLNALVQFITGVLSWMTVFHIIRILPVASSLRSRAELEGEIAERKKVEEELKISNQHLKMAQEIVELGHWQWDVVANKVTWSDGLYNIYGMKPDGEISYQSYLDKLHPDDKPFVDSAVKKAFEEKKFPPFIHRIILSDGSEKILQSKGDVLINDKGEVVKMFGTAQDITDSQKAKQQLEERTHALEITNAELQRFAYVASHDLQEPLRKIMTFASLLAKELDGSENDKTRLYMEKIVQSSGRMQRLIDDILTFSSLRVTNETFTRTDLNAVIKQVLSDIEVRIENTGATVHVEDLPTIDAIPSQMDQLFQNLLSNSLKFRRDNVAPIIVITCKLVDVEEVTNYNPKESETLSANVGSFDRVHEQFAKIEISDNGIGFDEEYTDKIFEIFQRLHSNKAFDGTGVGLAICKRIVDNHHGVISATAKAGHGATFTLFLPLSQKRPQAKI